jgi:hypothetical protein
MVDARSAGWPPVSSAGIASTHPGTPSADHDGRRATASPSRSRRYRALAQLKADPDAVSLGAVLTEIRKLQAVRTLGLPVDLFADVWWARRRTDTDMIMCGL